MTAIISLSAYRASRVGILPAGAVEVRFPEGRARAWLEQVQKG